MQTKDKNNTLTLNFSLPYLLETRKEELREELDNTASIHGLNSWLFLPSRPTAPPVCLVAHIDTVYEEPASKYLRSLTFGLDYPSSQTQTKSLQKLVLYDQSKKVYWSPQGLGADDRAGVYAVSKLRHLHGCMTLFTDLEETGGIGAREASRLYTSHFSSIEFFIQIDRRGRGECVFYDRESRKLKKFVEKFGFKEYPGLFTDVLILSEALHIPAVNLSAGYYNNHTLTEFLVEDDLNYTIDAVSEILSSIESSRPRRRKEV